jgi:hypothetical protein
VLHTREVPIEADQKKFSDDHPAYSTPPQNDLTMRGPIGIVGVNDDATNNNRRHRKHG